MEERSSDITPMDRHERIPADEIDVPPPTSYVHPAIRIGLAVLALGVGSAAILGSLMAIFAGDVAPPADPAGFGRPDTEAAWPGLVSGVCWVLAGVFTWRGRLIPTAIFFVIAIIAGLFVTVM